MRKWIFSCLMILLISAIGCAKITPYVFTQYKWFHYGYGQKGEYYYLKNNDQKNLRFCELEKMLIANNNNDQVFDGDITFWAYGLLNTDILRTEGTPLNVRFFVDEKGVHYEDWEYNYYIMVFKEHKLFSVKSTGNNPEQEYLWFDGRYAI